MKRPHMRKVSAKFRTCGCCIVANAGTSLLNMRDRELEIERENEIGNEIGE